MPPPPQQHLYNGLARPAASGLLRFSTEKEVHVGSGNWEWTCSHGQHAGLRPSWLAIVVTGQTGQLSLSYLRGR